MTAAASSSVHDIYRVESSVVKCDGTGQGSDIGHPAVYLNMGEKGRIECPYCSRQFVLVERISAPDDKEPG